VSLPRGARGALLGAALVVAGWGFAASYFIWRAHFEPARRTYHLDWQSPWIAYAQGEPGATFFRRKLYVPSSVRHAWVQVAAVDSFELFVNANSVGASKRVGYAASGVYDITSRLRPGLNVVAVAADRASFPGPTQLAVEGAYIDWQGEVHAFGSDETWRASLLPERTAHGGARWTQASFDDVLWAPARVLGVPLRREDTKVNYPPILITQPSPARWSWGPTAEDAQSYVRCTFPASADVAESWVEVSAGDAHSIFVNGILVGRQDSWVGVSGVNEESSRRSVDIYNATRFVRPGNNVLAISATGAPASRRLLAAATLIARDFTVQRFATPSSCRAASNAVEGWTGRDFDDSSWTSLQPVGTTSTPAEVFARRRVLRPSLPDSYQIRMLVTRAFLIAGMLALAGAWWLGAAALTARRHGMPLERALSIQRLPFLWGALLLGVMFLVAFDTRFSTYFAFKIRWVATSAAVVLLLQLALWLRQGHADVKDPARPAKSRKWRAVPLAELVAIAAITIGGLALRLEGAGREPLSGDEVTMAIVSQSIWSHGYPVRNISANLPPKFFTTSEIVPFPMALAIRLLGPTELGVRLAGVLFGVATIPLLYLAGRSLFEPRVGLLAAGLFAWLPFAIKMSHYARYPSQLAFFALLTGWLLCESLRDGFDRRKYALGVAAAGLMYLSWEGAALMMPALLVGVLVLRRRDVSWMRPAALWVGGAAFVLLVFVQISARIHFNEDWAGLGIGISQLVPTPLWRQPLFDPWVYVLKLFGLENLQTTSLVAALGLVFAVRDRVLAYVYAVLLVTTVIMTLFLETQDSRHLYHMLPFLVLAGARAFWLLAEELGGGLDSRGRELAVQCGILIVFLLSANAYVLKLYGLPGNHNVDDVRLEADRPAGVSLAFPEAARDRPLQRAVVSFQPHVAWFYLGRGDYYSESQLQIPVAVASDSAEPVHRLTGSPLLYSLEDLRWVLTVDPNTVIVTPQRGAKLLARDVRRFLTEEMKVVYEDSRVRVYALTFTRREG
jgi:dolichyl-phosphate-mannose-protein mannosyltransferase